MSALRRLDDWLAEREKGYGAQKRDEVADEATRAIARRLEAEYREIRRVLLTIGRETGADDATT